MTYVPRVVVAGVLWFLADMFGTDIEIQRDTHVAELIGEQIDNLIQEKKCRVDYTFDRQADAEAMSQLFDYLQKPEIRVSAIELVQKENKDIDPESVAVRISRKDNVMYGVVSFSFRHGSSHELVFWPCPRGCRPTLGPIVNTPYAHICA